MKGAAAAIVTVLLGRGYASLEGPRHARHYHVPVADPTSQGSENGTTAAFPLWLPTWWTTGTQMTWQSSNKTSGHDPERYYSQFGEEKYAEKHFFQGGQDGGFYLEMGGLDGVSLSTTLHFQREHGWKGILIEPSPTNYKELVVNRAEDICINLAVCSQPQNVHFIDKGGVSGIYEFMPESFQQQFHPGLDHVDALPIIPCHPLTNVLPKLGVTHIDFFTLDVEGAELQVLQTFPFDSVTISVFCVEASGHARDKDESVILLLESQGYDYHGEAFGSNWFVHKQYRS